MADTKDPDVQVESKAKTKEVALAEIEKTKKDISMGYVPWGVLSFEELDSAHTAMKKSSDMNTVVWQLHDLIDNIMGSSEVEDKQAKVVSLMSEFAARTGQVMSDSGEKKSAGAQEKTTAESVVEFVKSALKIKGADTKPKEDPSNALTFVKSKDGTYRWVATYSNSFRDNDRPAEIISSKSHKRFVEMVDKGEYPLPELWLWHEKDWKWGQATVVAVDEIEDGVVMAVSAGTVDKGKEWVAEALMKSGAILPVSHGMPVTEVVREKGNPTIIEQHQTKEISPLPLGKEANEITVFHILKERLDMAISTEKRAEMAEALGVEPKVLGDIEASNQSAAEAAIAAKVQAKSKAKDEEDEDKDDPKKESGSEDLSNKDLAEFIGAVVKGLTEGFSAMRSDIDALQTAVEETSEKSREKETESAASALYQSILKSATGQDGVAAKKAAKESKPKEASSAPNSFNQNGMIVPNIIQELSQKSRSTHRGVAEGGN